MKQWRIILFVHKTGVLHMSNILMDRNKCFIYATFATWRLSIYAANDMYFHIKMRNMPRSQNCRRVSDVNIRNVRWSITTIRKETYYSYTHPNRTEPSSYVKSSLPSAAYMRQWIGLALVQILVYRLIGAKPLSEAMLEYCWLES